MNDKEKIFLLLGIKCATYCLRDEFDQTFKQKLDAIDRIVDDIALRQNISEEVKTGLNIDKDLRKWRKTLRK